MTGWNHTGVIKAFQPVQRATDQRLIAWDRFNEGVIMYLSSLAKRIASVSLIALAGIACLALLGNAVAQSQAKGPASLAAPAVTTVTTTLSYQGRINLNGKPYDGYGHFMFAIVNGAGSQAYWTNDGTNLLTAPYTPTNPVHLQVANGLFNVLLGDTGLTNMTALPATTFSRPDRSLRIWFSTDAVTYEQLMPDVRLAAVPYAFNAETLDGLDSSAFVRQNDLTAAGYITQGTADGRYARLSPTTQQIAMLKWYAAISTTWSNFGVGDTPIGIAFDGANMWVTNANSNTVSVLRASDGHHVMTPTVGGTPETIAFDGVNMWVPNFISNNVSVLRASDGHHVMTPTVGSGPLGIAFDGANMWVADGDSNSVSVLRASNGTHVMTPTVGNGPTAIAFDGAFMWVLNMDDNTVSKR